MKAEERKKARQLRHKGWPVREIAKFLSCSKSSVSKWVRDISLTPEQIEKLKLNQDRGRAKAANHPNSPKHVWQRIRESIVQLAIKDIPLRCDKQSLKIAGALLFWAEGYKRVHNVVFFSNSDPDMIRLMMRFFREICKVTESKFRGALHIHPHLDGRKAESYWSEISGIPLKQFHKLQTAVSKASKGKRDTLPLGTFTIVISDVRLRSQIEGWITGIKKWAVSSVGRTLVLHTRGQRFKSSTAHHKR